MIDQLSNKYLLNIFMVYLGHAILGDKGRKLQLEIIDQLSNKYLLKINGLPGCAVDIIYQLLTRYILK